MCVWAGGGGVKCLGRHTMKWPCRSKACQEVQPMRAVKNVFCMAILVAVVLVLVKYRSLAPKHVQKYLLRDTIRVKKGRVLTLNFTGQQVAGLRGMLSQQCWLDSYTLPMTIVEPFISDSTIRHSPKLWWRSENSSQLKVHDFYKLSSTGLHLTGWNDFISSAPRALILLNIENIHVKGCLDFSARSPPCVLLDQQPSAEIANCSANTTANVIAALSFLESHGFRVSHRLCLDCHLIKKDITPDQILSSVFRGYDPSNVTLMINQWKFSISMTPNCTLSKCSGVKESFRGIHSTLKLDRDADQYLELMGVDTEGEAGERGTVIGVMIRIEWFLIRYKRRSTRKISSCLLRVKQAVEAIKNAGARASLKAQIVAALDVGRFGSDTFQGTLKRNNVPQEQFNLISAQVKHFVEVALFNRKMSFQEWEESFPAATGGVTDRGYIAALQSLIVSKADCLVLVGGGHFQELTIAKYKSRNPSEKCIHSICAW